MLDRERQRAEINRRMVAGDIDEPQANEKVLDLDGRRKSRPAPHAALGEAVGGWISEDAAARIEAEERHARDIARFMQRREEAPKPAAMLRTKRAKGKPLPGFPFAVTANQARLLDLRALGATVREIATVELLAAGTVKAELARLDGILRAAVPSRDGLRSLVARTIVWRTLSLEADHVPDRDLHLALRLVKGRAGGDEGEEFTGAGEVADAW